MIDTKELMIGNWVNTKDLGIVKVCSIRDRNISFSNEWGDYDIDYICPKGIPVTPELLERIGFEKEFNHICSEHYWAMAIGADYYLDINNPMGEDWYLHIDGWDRDTLGGGYFRSLHELQNLVRVITGHDLPITKEMLG